MTSHELNAGYEPAWSPSAWSAVRRDTNKTAWDVGGKDLSIFSILWALMILLGLNYKHCIAYTPQRFLDSCATRPGKWVSARTGNSNCTTAYSYIRAIGQETTIARFCEHCQVVLLHFRTCALYTTLRHCYKHDSFQESRHMYEVHRHDWKSVQQCAPQATKAWLERKHYFELWSPATNVWLITVQDSY